MAANTDVRYGLYSGVAIKAPCKVASVSNLTLEAEQTVDGVALVEGDRVLVKSQTTGTENGVYTVSTGAWLRAVDFDGYRDVVENTQVFCGAGETLPAAMYRLATANPVIGTSSLTFTRVFDVSSVGSLDEPFGVFLSGNGSQTSWTLTDNLGVSEKALWIEYDAGGAEGYQPVDFNDYTINGTTLTFTGFTPVLGANNIYVRAPGLTVGSYTGVAEAAAAAAEASASLAAASEDAVRTLTGSLEGKAISVLNYGAVGNGIADDSAAIQAALDTNARVLLPEGDFVLNSGIHLNDYNVLYGLGTQSRLLPSAGIDAITITAKQCQLRDLWIDMAETGVGIRIVSVNPHECTQNTIERVYITDPTDGIIIDGGSDPSYPDYWSTIRDVLIERPLNSGITMTKQSGGDSPNAWTFENVRVFSKGRAMSGVKSAFYIHSGKNRNTFRDCEGNLESGATSIFHFGADTGDTKIDNATMECVGAANGIYLTSGAGAGANGPFSFYDLRHQTGGGAIVHTAGERYFTCVNTVSQLTGLPLDRHRFYGRVRYEDVIYEKLFYETEDLTPTGTIILNSAVTLTRLNAGSGAFNADLPAPSDATDGTGNAGQVKTIIKTSDDENVITIRVNGATSSGPNGANYKLVKKYDFIIVQSNGSEWMIIGSNKPREGWHTHTAATDGNSYTVNPDIEKHVVVPAASTCTATLPAASTATGREIWIDRKGAGAGNVSVVVPSLYTYTIGAANSYLRFASDGANWYETGKVGTIS